MINGDAKGDRIARVNAKTSGCPSIRLTRREVDVLYDTLEKLDLILRNILQVSYILIAGSLLGAVRSQSILFNDDDIDIAIVCPEHHTIVQKSLSETVKDFAYFKHRPFPCCDRIRPKALSHLWIDIFYIKRYNSLSEIIDLVETKDNGTKQPAAYITRITEEIVQHLSSSENFPIWHYDNRKAIELWPREFFFECELFPLNKDVTLSKGTSCANQCLSEFPFFHLGHLLIPGPFEPLGYLMRSYGTDCFDVFPINVDHSSWVKEFRDRKINDLKEENPYLSSLTIVSGIARLEEQHFLPVQHSKKAIESTFNKLALAEYLKLHMRQVSK